MNDPTRELDKDDTEELGIDDHVEDDVEGDDDEVFIQPPVEDAEVVDLYPWAFGKEHHKKMFKILGGDGVKHVIFFSSSAHPAPAMAAHELNLRIHMVFNRRVSEHAKNHALQRLKEQLFRSFYAEERAKLDSGSSMNIAYP